MRYRTLGASGVKVSEVGFGVWTIATGWWGEYTDDEAVRLLHEARDLGITFFDTADTYGEGRGERLLAKAFADDQDIVIGTKFGYDIYSPWDRKGHAERPHDWNPDFIRFAFEHSLTRLGREYVDHYALHNPRMDAVQNDAIFDLLEEFKAAGRIRSYGAALGPAIGWRDEGVEVLQTRPLDALQLIHNALEQHPGRELLAAAESNAISAIVRVPHSSGMLEGHYTVDTVFAENDHRRHRPRQWLIEGLEKIATLDFLTEGSDRTLGQSALQWLLANPIVATTLPNIYNRDQLVEFAAATDTQPLSTEEVARVDALFDANFGLAAAAV